MILLESLPTMIGYAWRLQELTLGRQLSAAPFKRTLSIISLISLLSTAAPSSLEPIIPDRVLATAGS